VYVRFATEEFSKIARVDAFPFFLLSQLLFIGLPHTPLSQRQRMDKDYITEEDKEWVKQAPKGDTRIVLVLLDNDWQFQEKLFLNSRPELNKIAGSRKNLPFRFYDRVSDRIDKVRALVVVEEDASPRVELPSLFRGINDDLTPVSYIIDTGAERTCLRVDKGMMEYLSKSRPGERQQIVVGNNAPVIGFHIEGFIEIDGHNLAIKTLVSDHLIDNLLGMDVIQQCALAYHGGRCNLSIAFSQ
jgi:predicted aspartyl protease